MIKEGPGEGRTLLGYSCVVPNSDHSFPTHDGVFRPIVAPEPIPDRIPDFHNVFVGPGTGISFTTGHHAHFIGRCSGASLLRGTDVTLIGDYTSAPRPEVHNFTNIYNKWCRWNGEPVTCPPPEPECMK
jgi:hypothetical protein